MTQNTHKSPTCSDLAIDQALAGTAPCAAAWVIFEYAGPWSREALSAETFAGDPIGGKLLRTAQLLESLGAKVLLARESGASHTPLRRDSRVWVALMPDYAPHVGTIGEVLDRLGESHRQTLAQILDSSYLSPMGAPHIFICSHGKRDQCCAVKGRALARGLRSRHAHVLECSHLGGHRFAPTALLLPRGGVFGRLTDSSVDAILAGQSTGIEELRGLSSLGPPEQVVDIAAKKIWQLPWSACLSIDPIDLNVDDSTFMVKAPDERRMRCTVSKTSEILPMSCGKPASDTNVWRVAKVCEE